MKPTAITATQQPTLDLGLKEVKSVVDQKPEPDPVWPETKFIANLDEAINRKNKQAQDPYGAIPAVLTALLEVRNSFADSVGQPKRTTL